MFTLSNMLSSIFGVFLMAEYTNHDVSTAIIATIDRLTRMTSPVFPTSFQSAKEPVMRINSSTCSVVYLRNFGLLN